ncbi:AIR synthase-related protein [Patescibacteria group bacterium]|nr:AIR synthase-related protein [Patescibacteria group bacterium]
MKFLCASRLTYNPTKPYKHKILSLIESTWSSPYIKVKKGLYPIFEKKTLFPEVQHTDGIGTKGFYYWRKKSFRSAVLDALAMNLNDLAMVGARPYALQNHIVLPKDDHKAILTIVSELAKECRKRKVVMTGGETSIHSDMPGMDISITVSGFVKIFPENQCRVGDVLIGIKSNGLHSNGITKVREIFGNQNRKEFTAPTRIYLDEILFVLEKHKVNGMMHITGGAFTKLKDILNKADAKINQPRRLQPQNIFREMYARGLSDEEMYSIFNCGVGFILSVPKTEVKEILSKVRDSAVLGEVARGVGKIQIHSSFSRRMIQL